MRGRYTVRLAIRDGTTESVVVWAESPEHAIKKAKSRLDPTVRVQRATATPYNVEEME